ncbi:anti-sigma factor [uncultured Paracoccus sp.]|uniref:anti-sigma factor n=1 Tax=uncultured Paracoccus sp. TaxID=189685 RepID=UPI00262C2609|nr:anti-sigma factor [uncultured Paracoccus sp.]
MTDTPPPPSDAPLTPDEETEALAAELALGLLAGDEAEAARKRIVEDTEFAAMVRLWQERLAGMANELTPVMAPTSARLGIQRSLGHGNQPLADVPQIHRGRGGSAGGSGGWMGWLLGAVAAGAVALAVILLPGQDQPGYVAQLAMEGMMVEAQVEGREIRVAMMEGEAHEGRDMELWWIAGPEATPVSLGLVPRDGSMTMALPEGLEPGTDVQLAISDEPLGGSPTGQPTGDIMAHSTLTQT